MREINKDLKMHFKALTDKVGELVRTGLGELEEQENQVKNYQSVAVVDQRKQELLDELDAMLREYRQKQNYDNLLTLGQVMPGHSQYEGAITTAESEEDLMVMMNSKVIAGLDMHTSGGGAPAGLTQSSNKKSVIFSDMRASTNPYDGVIYKK